MNFISFKQWLNEIFPKMQWELADPEEYGEDLVTLVQTAYRSTPKGSFINTKRDAVESDWLAIDLDDDPDLDATIFYRGPRTGETWKGKKIQGVGHDGSRAAIHIMLDKMKKLLLSDEHFWVECSDAMEHVLYQLLVPHVDEETAQKVFPNTDLKFIGDRGKYTRKLPHGEIVKETIFGNPEV
jgi:hypothetical protein